MKKVLFDTNIILDILENKSDFVNTSPEIFTPKEFLKLEL